MRIAIGMWVLLLAASATTVAAQGDEGVIAVNSGWAMAAMPVPQPPDSFNPFGPERYRPASPALLDDGARPVSAHSYPTSLDWRRKDGQDWTTPVRQASTCGSCAAFAVIGSIESRLKIAAGDSSLNIDLSEAHLFFGSCHQCCLGGMTVGPALDFARDTGIADDACYPYSPQNQPYSPCAGWQSRTTAIAGWTGTSDIAEMKQALAEGGPIVAALTLYEDFRSYSGGIYQHTHGGFAGSHAVTLVGYNDAEGYWIGKNSWGTDWGEDKDGNEEGGGWFRIFYGQAGIDDYAYIPLLSVDHSGTNSMTLAFGTGDRPRGSPR